MVLPEPEVENLGSQLASQVQYTNELLFELNAREEEAVAAQRNIQTKQTALRQAMAVCDSVRADNNELRKKYAIAQELSSRSAADAKRWKVECEVRGKEVEGLEKFAEEARNEIESLRAKEELQARKLADSEAERERLSEQIRRWAEEEELRISKYRESYELLSRELADLKTEHYPVKNENVVLKARNEELERITKQYEADIKRHREDLDSAKRTISQLEKTERDMHVLESQYRSDLHNEASKAQRTQEQAEAAKAAALARQQELEDAREEAVRLKESNRALQDEIRSLHSEIETVGNDLLAQSEARSADKERMETRIRELQEELGRLASETRDRERSASDTLRSKVAEFGEQRRAAEIQYSRLQEEYRQLHDLLQRTQNEKDAITQQMDITRQELESRIVSLQERARSAEEDLGKKDTEQKRSNGMLLAEIQRLENESIARSSGELEGLSILLSTVQQLSAECASANDMYAQACQELENLRDELANYKRNGAVSLQDWHAETKRSLADLAEANSRTRILYEETRNAQLEAEVQRDEERAKNLMLAEERRRLDDEVQYLRQSVQSLEEASRERLENARLDYESATQEQDTLEKRVQMLTQQVEELNSQNRVLQEERQRASSSLTENHQRVSLRVTALERQLEEAETKLRKTVNERDSLDADRELMKRTVKDYNITIANLQKQISNLETINRDTIDREKSSVKSSDTQLAVLRENSRKIQTQLAQTRQILKVVQEQRKNLQEDNVALRQELDEVLRRSLNSNAAASIPARPKSRPITLGTTEPQQIEEQPELDQLQRMSSRGSLAIDPPVLSSVGARFSPRKPIQGSQSAIPPRVPETRPATIASRDAEPTDPSESSPVVEREEEQASDAEDNLDNDEPGFNTLNNPLDMDLEKLQREVDELQANE